MKEKIKKEIHDAEVDSSGVCERNEDGKLIRQTKFKTEVSANKILNDYKNIGVMPMDSITFKCKKCNMWHIGKLNKK